MFYDLIDTLTNVLKLTKNLEVKKKRRKTNKYNTKCSFSNSKQIITLYFEFETVLKSYNLKARTVVLVYFDRHKLCVFAQELLIKYTANGYLQNAHHKKV